MFDDPRWAGALDRVDATRCTTCHREHRPSPEGVTVPAAFCFPCHDDVVTKRPSHRGFTESSCGRGGCHNYHDNAALNPAFLRARVADADTHPASEALSREAPRSAPLPPIDVPDRVAVPSAVAAAWRASAHPGANVTCMSCHKSKNGSFTATPGFGPCAECHRSEASTFGTGPHGLRQALALPSLTVDQTRLAMKHPTSGRPAGTSCGTCHDAHSVDTRKASVDACLGCHDDPHSRAYRDSKHYRDFSDRPAARRPGPDDVTCATCHMPRVRIEEAGKARVAVNHDNGKWLHPRSRMANAVCLRCHGLDFTLSNLFDDGTVARNFGVRAASHHPTTAMLEALDAAGPPARR
jgi:predicted CXXCH cytochrome family protein